MNQDHLTEKEREALYLLAQGCSIRETAQQMERSSESINLYIKQAKQKLNASTLDQLIALAISRGQI